MLVLIPIFLFAALIALYGYIMWVVVRNIRRVFVEDRRQHHGACVTCGYNLTGNVSGVCPECGTGLAGRDRSA